MPLESNEYICVFISSNHAWQHRHAICLIEATKVRDFICAIIVSKAIQTNVTSQLSTPIASTHTVSKTHKHKHYTSITH
jgi:hypothetical protein